MQRKQTKDFFNSQAVIRVGIKHTPHQVLGILRNMRPRIPLKVDNRLHNCLCNPFFGFCTTQGKECLYYKPFPQIFTLN